MKKLVLLGAALVLSTAASAQAQTTLGTFMFDNTKFGTSASLSNPGFFTNNWLNVANANPGIVAGLTGVNFDTGVANLGVGGAVITARIDYAGGIQNGAGDDFGVVVARYSTDAFRARVSLDGVSFGSWVDVSSASGIDSNEDRTYFYNGNGPFSADLFVHSLDLSAFGVAGAQSVLAIEIEGSSELDLIRVAGFGTSSSVPEPSALALLVPGLVAVAGVARRRAARSA